MNISIVIPNWNGRELLEKNLPYVVKVFENKKNKVLEIIVVDDASSDESVKFLKKNFENVKVVVHKTNRGFAAAVNTGARTARGTLICLLNSDVLPSENCLQTINEDFEDSKVFAVSLHEKGYGPAKGKFTEGFIGHGGLSEKTHVADSFWASGGSAAFRRSIWMELKGMDDDLLSPFYWEDIDLCYRAQKRGYKVLWDPRCIVEHHHESTVKKLNQGWVARIRERNQLLFMWKNITSRNLLKKHRKFLLRRILKHPGYLRIVLMALTKWKKMKELRKIEMKESKVSDEAIFAKFN